MITLAVVAAIVVIGLGLRSRATHRAGQAGAMTPSSQTKLAISFLALVIVLCGGPIVWEVGFHVTRLKDPYELLNTLGGGHTAVFLLLALILIPTGLQAPALVTVSIVVAVAASVNKSVPRWAKVSVWLPIAAAMPAVLVVIRLGAALSTMNRLPAPIYAKNKAAYLGVRSMAWCAIQYRQQHEDSGYPAGLDDLKAFACRSKWNVADLPGYNLAYEPRGGAVGRIGEFSITARPPSGDPRLRTYESDGSGLVYVQSVTGNDSSRSLVFPYNVTGDYSLPFQQEYSLVADLYDCLQVFADSNPNIGYPADLKTVQAQTPVRVKACYAAPMLWQIDRHTTGNIFSIGNYEYLYEPGPANPSGYRSTFELHAHCVSYGSRCIRNLYANQDSELHVTAEDRPATLDDDIEPVHVQRKPR